MIGKLEKQLKEKVDKAALGDYIRLLQLQKELEEEEPTDIQVTWVDPETKPDSES